MLSLWQRRSQPGSVTLVALCTALWSGIWLRVLEGDSTLGLGVSFALLQFAPVLFYMAVRDHLTPNVTENLALRRGVLAMGCAFAALAATSFQHDYFIGVSEAASAQVVSYFAGSYLALGFSLLVTALGIYHALADGTHSASIAVRSVVFIAFPLVLLALGLSGYMLGVTVDGMNPVLPGLAVTAALGAWLLVRFEFQQDDSVRNLLFARLPDPVVALDEDHRVVDCNDAFADLVDYPLDELAGSSLQSLVSESNFQALTEPDGLEFELRWEHADKVVEHYGVAALALEGKNGARVLHLTESDSHRHAQQALETADLRLEQANASLDRLTFNDELTGLANQRRFVDELEKEIARHQRSGLRFGVIAIEADHFNQLAEQHGSAFRDRSLALIARAIEVEVRDTDLCARLEGEEFAVLAVQMKVPGLVNLAERIRKRVLKVRPHAPGGERVRMSVSCGVGIFDPKQDDLRGLLARTNRYLVEAQRSGRNQVVSGD